MKFQPRRLNKLNEALLGKNNMDVEVEDKLVGTASATYVDAVKQHKEIEKKIKDDFNKVITNTDEFVKD